MRINQSYPITISIFSVFKESILNNKYEIGIEFYFDLYESLMFKQSLDLDDSLINGGELKEIAEIDITDKEINYYLKNIEKVIKDTLKLFGMSIKDVFYNHKTSIYSFTVINKNESNSIEIVKDIIDDYLHNYKFDYEFEEIEKVIYNKLLNNKKKIKSISSKDIGEIYLQQDSVYFKNNGNIKFLNWYKDKLGNNNQIDGIFNIVLCSKIELFLMNLFINKYITNYTKIDNHLYEVNLNTLLQNEVLKKKERAKKDKIIFSYIKNNKKLIIQDHIGNQKFLLKEVELDSDYDFLSSALFEIDDGIITIEKIKSRYKKKITDLSDLKKHLKFNHCLNKLFFNNSSKGKLDFNKNITLEILEKNNYKYEDVSSYLKEKFSIDN